MDGPYSKNTTTSNISKIRCIQFLQVQPESWELIKKSTLNVKQLLNIR
jgi:hypothetical protein